MNFCFSISLAWLGVLASAAATEPVSFRADIAPILLDQCQSCHGPRKAESGFRLDTYARAIRSGADEIHARVSSDDADVRMPPEGDPLPPEQIALFQRWLAEGGKFDGDDPDASLAAITPGVTHPDPPNHYARPIPITALAFSPDGEQLLVGGYREVTVWNVADSTLARRITNLPQRVLGIDTNPAGDRLVVAGGIPGRLGEVRVLDFASGEVLETLHKSDDLCFSARFSPDGRQLATGGADGTIRVFRSDTWHTQLVFANHSDWVYQVAWHREGGKIASASRDHTAKVFDVVEKERLTSYTGHSESVYAVCFDPAGDDVFSGGADGKLMRWRSSDGGTVREYARQSGAIFQIADMGPSQRLATAGRDPFVLTLGWNDPGRRETLATGSTANLSLAVSRSAGRIAAGDRAGRVRIWDTATGTLTAEFAAKP